MASWFTAAKAHSNIAIPKSDDQIVYLVKPWLHVHSLDFSYRLDYPGVGPEHSFLKDMGRAEYYSVTDEEALEGLY